MPTYELTTKTTYIFDAESDEEALYLVENDMEYIDDCIDHEEHIMLSTIYDECRIVRKW